jgi:tyrosine-protein phosphatase YwqE
MKVDCHCHILPEIDDGATSVEVSADLARRQVAWGFERAVCTSHRTRLYPNTPDRVNRACDRVREALAVRNIPLELVPSMEYRLIPETWPETLQKGWLLPWEGRHLLIELPISNRFKVGNIVPLDEVKRLLDMDYQPVLAHPERYLYLTMEDYMGFKEAGCLFQRNAGSLEGLYGEEVIVRARSLAEAGLYDLFGTDLHNERYAHFFDQIHLQAQDFPEG